MPTPTLRIGLVDMNNGVRNEAMRCFRRILSRFRQRVRECNPELVAPPPDEVQPRNRGDRLEGRPYDLVISSGGPGSPRDIEQPWGVEYRKLLQDVFDRNQRDAATAPKLFAVCYSFELAVLHFGVAEMEPRDLKCGLMPAYTTRAGREVDYLKPFDDRLFTWEYREWQPVHPDPARLRELGGRILAQESREDQPPDKGEALLALSFAQGIDGTQFHPEADKPGVLRWMQDEEHAEQLKAQHGEVVYERMLKSLNDEARLARTYALFLPGWLTCRFNDFARERGLVPLPAPELDLAEFGV